MSERQAALLALAGQVIPGSSFTHLLLPEEVNLVFARGQGARVWDQAGRSYIDWVLGSGPLLVGHAHPQVVAAVQEVVGNGSTFYGLNEPAIRLAAELVEAAANGEQAILCSDGSIATFYALRLARAYTGREKIVKFEGAYHGHHDLARFGNGRADFDYPHAPADSAGIPAAVRDQVLVVPFNDLNTVEDVLRRHYNDIAAVIIEPLQRAIAPEPGFLAGLRALTEQYGVLLIFDEVVTGFRLAYGGAQAYYGVTADLVCYGKVIGGGYPLAAVVGPREIMRLADARRPSEQSIFYNGTLNGNPVAAAAGLATLQLLKQPGVYERLHDHGREVRERLNATFRAAGVRCQAIGDGPLFQLAFVDGPVRTHRDLRDNDREAQRAWTIELLKRGQLLNPGKAYVSTAHDAAAIDALVATVEEICAVLQPA